MTVRSNVLGSVLVGSFIAWISFMHLHVIYPIQYAAFEAAFNDKCNNGTWSGNVRLGGVYTNEQYIVTTRAISKSLYKFINLSTKLSLNTLHYIGPTLTYLKVSTTLINMTMWYYIAPNNIFIPTLRDVTSISIEAETYHRYDANGMILIWGQIMALAILTIWARGVGPRFRPDQLSDLTWKDLLIFLFGVLILTIAFIH